VEEGGPVTAMAPLADARIASNRAMAARGSGDSLEGLVRFMVSPSERPGDWFCVDVDVDDDVDDWGHGLGWRTSIALGDRLAVSRIGARGDYSRFTAACE